MEEARLKPWCLRSNIVLVLGFSTRVIFAVALLALASCANHPCREPRAPELDATKVVKKTDGTIAGSKVPANASPAQTNVSNAGGFFNDEPPAAVHVRVFKADGSRQCEKRPGITVEKMETELAGIVVHAKEKRSDGLMHIKVCGSPTGMINVFEIDQKFQKQAEQRGFVRLEE